MIPGGHIAWVLHTHRGGLHRGGWQCIFV